MTGTKSESTSLVPQSSKKKALTLHEQTPVKILVTIVTAGALAWASLITATVFSVTRLEPQIDQLIVNDQAQSEWINTWPTEGELVADVRQTRDIQILFEDMADALQSIDRNQERTQESLQSIEQRVRELELER